MGCMDRYIWKRCIYCGYIGGDWTFIDEPVGPGVYVVQSKCPKCGKYQ